MAEQALLLEAIHPNAADTFQTQGFEVVKFSKSASPAEIAQLAQGVRVLGVRSGPPIGKEVMEAAESLEAIGVYSVGFNHIDLKAANERGIAVFNAPHENTRSVAEFVMGLTSSLLRQIQAHNRSMHGGVWSKTESASFEMRGKTMGVIGYGTVGNQVVELALKNDMNALWYDPNPRMGHEQGRSERVSTIAELLRRSDIVSVHVPGGKQVIDRNAIFELMKSGSFLINTARAGAVDTEALADAIESGHLAGAALDVFDNEPGNRGDTFNHRLRGNDRVILTPHQGGSTEEAQESAGKNTTRKLLAYLATGKTVASVNLPEQDFPALQPRQTRILNIHRNVPGAEVAILARVSEQGINIDRTHLETRGGIGYVALDASGQVSPNVIKAIAELDATIRARVIEA